MYATHILQFCFYANFAQVELVVIRTIVLRLSIRRPSEIISHFRPGMSPVRSGTVNSHTAG